MHGEIPELKRCCFCIPLRRGLIAWGYAKLVLHILALIYVAFIIYCLGFIGWTPLDAKTIAVLTCINVCLLLDMSFNILFIVAGHKKSVKLLRISYVYNIVWLGLQTLGNCFVLYVNLETVYRFWSHIMNYNNYLIFDMLIILGFAFTLIFVQIYLILLIRSEITKLCNQTLEMQFTNHAATGEPQCTLHSASDTEHCTDTKHVVQDCCTDKKHVVQDCCTDKKHVVQDCCTDIKPAVQDSTNDKGYVA